MKHGIIGIWAAGMILAGCTSGTAPADAIAQKELNWAVGDERIYIDENFEEPGIPVSYDTARVVSYDVVDSHRTLEWSNGRRERISGTNYQRQIPYVWITWARVPSVRGEVIQQDTFTRTAEDGTQLGKALLQWVTTSPDTIITVPAGTFRCTAMTTVNRTLDGAIQDNIVRYTQWYAPGVGIVQTEDYIGDHGTLYRSRLAEIRRH